MHMVYSINISGKCAKNNWNLYKAELLNKCAVFVNSLTTVNYLVPRTLCCVQLTEQHHRTYHTNISRPRRPIIDWSTAKPSLIHARHRDGEHHQPSQCWWQLSEQTTMWQADTNESTATEHEPASNPACWYCFHTEKLVLYRSRWDQCLNRSWGDISARHENNFTQKYSQLGSLSQMVKYQCQDY